MAERLGWAVVLGLVGWLVGLLSAWVTRWLERSDAPTGSHGPTGSALPRWRLVALDPLVQGLCALVGAAAAVFLAGSPLRWVEASLLAVPLIQVAVTDYRTRYVYTVVAGIGLVIGLAFGWQVHDAAWWTSVAGALGAFAAFALLYGLGRLIYRGQVEAMARGDITIAAMVGAGAAACTPQALFEGVLFGGLLAVALLIVRRSRHASMPYGPGLCLGGLATLFLC